MISDPKGDEVVTYLNEVLAHIGPIVENSGGRTDKYIGDSILEPA